MIENMKYYLFIVLSAIGSAAIGLFTKLIGSDVPLMTLIFLRFLIATIVISFLAPQLDKDTFKLKKTDLKDYIIIASLFVINFSLYLPANLLAPIQNVILINASYIFIVFILAYFFLGEKITKTKLFTTALAVLGLSVINPFQAGEYFLGNMLALISGFTFAILLVKLRKANMSHGIGDLFWFFLFATILSLPFPFIFGFGQIKSVWLLVLGLGVISTALNYFFFNLSLEKIEVEIVSLISLIISPVSAILLAYFFLGEAFQVRTIIGGSFLILAGIYFQLHKKKTKP